MNIVIKALYYRFMEGHCGISEAGYVFHQYYYPRPAGNNRLICEFMKKYSVVDLDF